MFLALGFKVAAITVVKEENNVEDFNNAFFYTHYLHYIVILIGVNVHIFVMQTV